MISLETARQLLDFAGGTVAQKARLGYAAAESQLEGAVALHNILEAKRVAYLADEVGLGKTYVALGAFALFRHFNPKFRLLVIAPKENIQRKWIKELRNFVRNNIRFPDLRVKSLQDTPARSPVYCSNLYELVRETSIDPDRDFFARLTSFSFGLAEDSEGWRKRRDRLLALLPWIDADLFDLRNKERFKQNYARAVCCAIPAFDLVIIDEGHNLKHGLQRSASLRNHLLALTFGNDNGEGINRRTLPYYGRRARRVLFLSATPLEEDYYQIWNQLDVVGFGEAEPSLCDPNISDEQKREALSSFLIRRVSSVQVAGEQLTKNLYRREWRSGGVAIHDESLPVPDERQRLVVALIQKKVSELLASERFNNSFQIGMLASFESFLRTAKVAANGADGTFDDSQQTDDFIEREGIDVDAVNRLTDSYKRHFYRPMPHPKMDALVDTLRSSFDTGKKALVFVRRVASVKEIKGKLDDEYDAWLFRRLRTELLPSLQDRLEKLIERYRSERATRKQTSIEATPVDGSVEEDDLLVEEDDRGDIDTFFAWYFRGDGPSDVLSGAAIAKRFIQSRFALSSFFSDNYVAELLGARPGAVFQALVAYTGMSESVLKTEVEGRAGSLLRADQKKRRHYDLFFAFQHSAISLLAETAGRLQHDASIVLDTVFQGAAGGETGAVPLGDWLERPTFFTELRDKPELLHEIWMPAEESHLAFAPGFKRRELRRELVASMFRLGHSFIDLYIAIINQLGRIGRDGAAEDLDNQALARGVLAVLEHQRCSNPFRAYHELREASANFDLILDVNAPRLWELPIESVSIEIGKLLRAQQPVGGMSGQVNQTLVRQFRMPAYPFVLIATDLLQEGEDLHLFCSDVYHYGIAWVPSAMEQRIGRIDRVRSQTERRLASATGYPDGQDLLQVYYPHLRETVEVFQVNRVLDRMTRFIKLMHENLVAPEDDHDPKINVVHEIQQKSRVSEISREPLRSAFPVARSLLKGPRKPLPVSNKLSQDLLQRFACIQDELEKGGVMWHPRTRNNSRIGSMHRGDRKQAFTIFLYSIHGYPNLRCVSPIGQIDPEVEHEIISREARLLPVRVAAVYDARFNHYKLTAEADVLLGHCVADVSRALWLVKMTTGAADLLEDVLLHLEQDVHGFTEDLDKEPQVER